MANSDSIAEKSAQYVLGELSPDERDEFEALLDQSDELRAHVQELEDGALAIATASARVAPPKNIWREINREIAHDERQKRLRVIVGAIFKNGWAAAAACLVGWLIYALTPDHTPSNRSQQPSLAASSPIGIPNASATNANASATSASNLLSSQPPTQTERQLEIANRESVLLRNQLAGLQQQIAQLSGTLTQQQAALNEPSRMKFLQLAPSTGLDKAVLSPAVQRALFYALANELGWLSLTNENHFSPPIAGDLGLTNGVNMDFVDLRTSNAPPIRLRAPAPKQLAQNTDTPASKDASPTGDTQPVASTVIPAFVSGTSLFFAVDSTMAYPSSQFVVSPGVLGLGEESSTVALNDAPVVVAVHAWNGAPEGTPWTVTFLGRETSSNVVFTVVRLPQNP